MQRWYKYCAKRYRLQIERSWFVWSKMKWMMHDSLREKDKLTVQLADHSKRNCYYIWHFTGTFTCGGGDSKFMLQQENSWLRFLGCNWCYSHGFECASPTTAVLTVALKILKQRLSKFQKNKEMLLHQSNIKPQTLTGTQEAIGKLDLSCIPTVQSRLGTLKLSPFPKIEEIPS